METKLCTKCGKTKPISEFGLNKSKKDGLQSYCKECVKEYKKTTLYRKQAILFG